jgi:hypothetical protein
MSGLDDLRSCFTPPCHGYLLATKTVFDSHRLGDLMCPSRARAYGTRICERRRRKKSCTEMVEKSKTKHPLRTAAVTCSSVGVDISEERGGEVGGGWWGEGVLGRLVWGQLLQALLLILLLLHQ